MARRDYPAPGITVHWDSELCEHSERCFQGAPTVFDPRARPWVQPGAEPPDVVAAAVDRCPSRALTYTRTDGTPPGPNGRADQDEAPGRDAPPTEPDGADRTAVEDPAATDLPVAVGDTADVADRAAGAGADGASGPTSRGPSSGEAEAATTVEPRRDGPLVVTGRVALAGPDGTAGEVVERLFLCRCGASGDKPRCDGTHKRIGFTAPGIDPPSRP